MFWDLGVISMTDEHWGAFTCWTSTLAVLADSDPFRGLLLTVFWSQNDFQGCQTPRCAYMLVIKTRSLGRFWPVSWTNILFWSTKVISTIDEPWGALTCRSSTLTVLADCGPFRGPLLTVLRSRSDFHD